MKLLNLYAFTTLFSRGCKSLTPTKRICKDCRHFIGDNIECRKFSDTNIVTGKVTYECARHVREDEKKCGKDAIYFEENHFKIVTVPYYFVKEHWIIISPLIGFGGLYFFLIFRIAHNSM
jgi:hypothetical protein